jgi:hypothetical protein
MWDFWREDDQPSSDGSPTSQLRVEASQKEPAKTNLVALSSSFNSYDIVRYKSGASPSLERSSRNDSIRTSSWRRPRCHGGVFAFHNVKCKAVDGTGAGTTAIRGRCISAMTTRERTTRWTPSRLGFAGFHSVLVGVTMIVTVSGDCALQSRNSKSRQQQ